MHMGITAENVAERYKISRAMQDQLACESQRRAAAAIAAGYLGEQIVPVEIAMRKGTVLFDTDEHVRAATTVEVLAGMKPAFKKDGGTVTAGNASGINDGASAVVLVAGDRLQALNVKPLAAWWATHTRAWTRPTWASAPCPPRRRCWRAPG